MESTTTEVVVAVLRSGPLRRVLLAYLLFGTAEFATWLAILVWAFERGGAATAGLVALMQLVPAALLAPLGSVLGDRLARNHALALGYAAQCVCMVAAGFALVTGLPFGIVVVLAASSASAVTLTRPVHQAILPDIVETPEQLTAGNSASSAIEGVAGFLGPAAGGLLLATHGAGAVFVVLGVAMGAAALLANGLVARPAMIRLVPERLGASALEGFRQLGTDVGAAMLVLMVGAQFLVVGLLDVLIVLLAIQVLGMDGSGAGVLTSALGAGAIIGAGATVVLVGRRRLVPAVLSGIAVTGIAIALLGIVRSPWAALVLLAAAGAGGAFLNVSSRTLLQRSASSEILSRIFGIQEGLSMAGLALGAILAPLLARWFGPHGAFVAAGAFLPLVGLLGWTRVRGLDERSLAPGVHLDLLLRSHLFAPLAARTLEVLSRSLTEVAVPAGQVVIREGDVGDLYYLVRSGQVTVAQGERQLRVLAAGDGFGEIALLRQVPRTATVTALTDVELLSVDRVSFLSAVTGSPRSMVAVEQVADRYLDGDADPRL